MRGIPEELLNKKYASLTNEVHLFNAGRHEMLKELMQECQELQEPWMTLDEFLKSGFCGKCWIPVMGTVIQVEYDNSGFWNGIRYLNDIGVTHVMPIHKPEPPK